MKPLNSVPPSTRATIVGVASVSQRTAQPMLHQVIVPWSSAQLGFYLMVVDTNV